MTGPLTLILLATGCDRNRVQGGILGEPIPIGSSFFSEHPDAFDDDGVLFVVMSSLPGACATYRRWEAQTAALEAPDDLEDAWATLFPTDFWEILVVMRVPETTASIARSDLFGLPWFEAPERNFTAYARFTHHHAARTAAWFDGSAPEADTQSSWLSHGGTLRVKDHNPGDDIRGVFQTETVQTDDVTFAGAVELHFDAELCGEAVGL